MSNCITLNTASITSVDTIKTVVPISQGPKGDKGDRGERGPQGLPGDARINDKAVSGFETWSSKKIVDYVQSNNTTWTPKTIVEGKVDHTNKGYIKGLEIEGNTHEGQGVGLKTENGYKIGVKTHGKNLFSGYRKAIPLKQGDYIFSSEVTKGAKRIIIKGTQDKDITTRDFYWNKTYNGYMLNGEFETLTNKKITTNKNINAIIELYGGNIEYKNLQLEEGTHATKYEPYKESTQEVIIQQQLNAGDKLVFENGEYVIKTSTGQTLKTNVNNEMLPATFDGVTYVTQDSGVKGTLKGQFPINSQAVITSLENRNKELEERLGQQEEMLTTLYSFYRGTLEE